MLLEMSHVFHVGSLDLRERPSSFSLEGPCLSVSRHPEEWKSIARIDGKIWTLTFEDALWFDACRLDDEIRGDMLVWSETEGFIEPKEIWRAWHFDGETEEWGYFSFPTKEEALHEVNDELKDEDVPSGNGELVDSVSGWKLTDKGMAALKRWPDRMDGEGGAIILYARYKLAAEQPDLVGVWWGEIYDPASLSCPRGGIFPERMHLFDIRDEYGMEPPQREQDTNFSLEIC